MLNQKEKNQISEAIDKEINGENFFGKIELVLTMERGRVKNICQVSKKNIKVF